MRFYHVDRKGSLTQGKTIGLTQYRDITPPSLQSHVDALFPHGVTEHGENYFLKAGTSAGKVNSVLELLFEYVRRSYYPKRPSRFESVFAWATVAEAKHFMDKYSNGRGAIWEVECGEAFRGNMTLLTLQNSLLVLSWRAHAYWEGVSGEAKPEVWEQLLVPPVTAVSPV